MKIFSLSASKIKSYKMCQFKYYMEYHLGLSTGTSFAAEQGNMVHVLFELAGQDIRDGKKPEDSYIINNWHKEVMHAYQQEGIWQLEPKVKDQVRECIGCDFHKDGFCDLANLPLDDFEGCPKPQYEDAVWLTRQVLNHPNLEYPLDPGRKILDVEDVFKMQIPDGDEVITVNGIIDVVTELDKDTVEIVDYKTGRYIQSYNDCKKDPQLLIYNLAAQKKWRNYENFVITIFYLRKKPLHLTFNEKDLRGTELALKHYWHVIGANDSPQRIRDKPFMNRRDKVICEKMCDMALCDREFAKFRDNGYQCLPPPEKVDRNRKEWLAHLHEDSQKAQGFKEMHGGKKDKKKASEGTKENFVPIDSVTVLGNGGAEDNVAQGSQEAKQEGMDRDPPAPE